MCSVIAGKIFRFCSFILEYHTNCMAVHCSLIGRMRVFDLFSQGFLYYNKREVYEIIMSVHGANK